MFVKHMSRWDRSSDDHLSFFPEKEVRQNWVSVHRADFPSHSGQGHVLKLKIFKQGGRVHHKKQS